MEYVSTVPKEVPEGMTLVHNRAYLLANPLKVSPEWEHRSSDGRVGYARSVVSLRIPAAFPLATPTVLHLEVLLDNGAYIWRLRIHEEGAPFGEGELGSGWAHDLEKAEREVWQAACDFLKGELQRSGNR